MKISKLIILWSLATFTGLGDRARADNLSVLASMCESTISRPSDSFTSIERRNWVNEATKAMCSSHFTDDQSFRSAAAAANIPVPIAGELFDVGGDAKASDREIQTAYDQTCLHNTSYGTGDSTGLIKSERLSDAMAASFRECVSQLPSIISSITKSGVFIQLALSGEKEFTILIHNYSSAPLTSIKSIFGVSRCHIDAATYTLGHPITLDVPRMELQAICDRATQSDLSVSIDTNEGISNVVHVPPVQNVIEELKTAIAEAYVKADNAEKAVTDLSRTKVQIQMGTFAIGNSMGQPTLVGPTAGGSGAAGISKIIPFPRKFVGPSDKIKVVVGLTKLDAEEGQGNIRVESKVIDINNEQFTIMVSTFASSKVNDAGFSYIAVLEPEKE